MFDLFGKVTAAAAVIVFATVASAQTPAQFHDATAALPTSGINPANPFGGATTQRSPANPREGESVRLFFKLCCQNTYNRVAFYYTLDGSEPQGSFGTPTGSTLALRSWEGGTTFAANDFNTGGGTRDWWVVTIPAAGRTYGQTVKWKTSQWTDGNGGSQTFNSTTSTIGAATTFSYTNKLAWPGQGSNFTGNEGLGYPPFWSWKEEGVVGNNWINSQLDQNGSYFDVYFPGAGGVQGVATKNEGYVDGLDTFPAGLPSSNRGQMHINQIFTGIRAGGVTSWLTNQNGTDFTNITQAYEPRTQTIRTSSRLVRAGRNIDIVQYDFSPKGVTYAANNNKMVIVKRMLLTNRNPTSETVNLYMYMDPALNGGDSFDSMFYDAARGAMVAFDNTFRTATNTGAIGAGQEYNPTTFPGYEKNVSVYLAASMKKLSAPGAAGGTSGSDAWRDTSSDNGQGWIGQQVVLPPDTAVEINFTLVGGFDGFAGATGTYAAQIAPVIDWFSANSAQTLQTQTDNYWINFLDNGVTVTTPDARLNTLFERGLLGTMLHFDEKNGGLIAGFRNGAYPYVWPRDMAWAGVTLSRSGHTEVVSEMTRYLRDITFREFEFWGRKGFWKQKYSTDGYVIWGAPQVDETAVIPWMVNYQFQVTGDMGYLTAAEPGNPANTTYAMVKDAAIAMSQTSGIEAARLNLRSAYPGAPANQVLMYSNNIWEDQYDTFIYSNANIIRGLRDARDIANTMGIGADAADFTNREQGLLPGFFGKLDWNRENTDISLLGVTYPFEIVQPNDVRAARIADRINGVAADGNGQTKPLVRLAGQYNNDASDYVGLIDRYYGDGYWGNSALGPTSAGPWFLSTLWYGCYYALRQDFNPGKADIDNHLFRLNRTVDFNGPIGFGAEQMAPANSLLYPGQSDFQLQTAWPNAWESMSFYVDAMMLFVDYKPNAPGNILQVEPKLPTGWTTMTFRNLEVGTKRISLTASEDLTGATHTFTNTTGGACNFDTVVRVPFGSTVCNVSVTSGTITFQSYDAATGRQTVRGTLNATAAGTTTVRVDTSCPVPSCLADVASDSLDTTRNPNGAVGSEDLDAFIAGFIAGDPAIADVASDSLDTAFNPNGSVGSEDLDAFIAAFIAGC